MEPGKESPEQLRERLRQAELRDNPNGAFSDGMNRAESGSLADLIGGLGWKGTTVIILLLVIGYIFYEIFTS